MFSRLKNRNWQVRQQRAWIGKLLIGSLLVLMASLGTLYWFWDALPATARSLPTYILARLQPARSHPAFVPTPSGVAPLAMARPRPSATPSLVPSATLGPQRGQSTTSVTPTATPTAVPFQAALPAASLSNIRHEYQGWNNCGPATLAMLLSYYGRTETQAQTAPVLKPDPDDKNVSPEELVAYAHQIGYEGRVIVGTDIALLQTLLTNQVPVMVESWYIPDPDDEMGHYLLLTGYDSTTLTFFDSYNGPNVQEEIQAFDELWKVFNRTAIVVWPPEQDEFVRVLLESKLPSEQMYERALDLAYAETEADPADKFAWFNVGTNLTALGDYANAARAFDTARSLNLPWRMLWYQFAPYEAYYQNQEYQTVIDLATSTLQGGNNLEESYYWRAQARLALGDSEGARRDLEAAIQLNANFGQARELLATHPQLK